MIKDILDSYNITRKMPENYIDGQLDFCKNEFSYSTYDVKLIELHNCILNKRGFVYEINKFRMNKISLLDPAKYPKEQTIGHYLKKVFIRKKKRLSDEKYLLVYDDWSNEHYHWFCDVLPRLFVIKEKLKDFILLLPDSPYVKNIGLKSLDFFELQPASITFVQHRKLVKIKHLNILTHTCLTGYVNDKIIKDMRTFISSKLKAMKPSDNKKIYISRDNARYRKVLNEPEVKEIVRSFGYEVVKFEELSWMEQIAISASAKSIVSIHGAGLINMFYMQPGGAVLEFRRDKIYHNQCFWHLSQALELKYFYLFGTPDDDNLVIEGDGCNLTIDTTLLRKTLAAMEENVK